MMRVLVIVIVALLVFVKDRSILAVNVQRLNLLISPVYSSSASCPAYMAADDNYENIFPSGGGSQCPCFHSNDGPTGPNWWAIDMGSRRKVNEIIVLNRRDCCANRLDNFLVGITDTFPNLTTVVRGRYPLCSQYHGAVPEGSFVAMRCDPKSPRGRFLIIQQPLNGVGFLTICELQIWVETDPPDLLRLQNQETFASSVHPRSRTSYAVDEKNDNDYTMFPDRFPCFQSSDEPGDPNWWAVDMGQRRRVDYVQLLNRADCCANRLDNFIVGVTDTRPSSETVVKDKYPECGRFNGPVAAGQSVNVVCGPATPIARYLIVQQPANGPGLLTICEVQVFVEPDPPRVDVFPLPLRVRDTFATSVRKSGAGDNSFCLAEHAINGKFLNTFPNNPMDPCVCFQSNDGPTGHNWWIVDMALLVQVHEVIVFNTKENGNRLNNFVVGVSNEAPNPDPPNIRPTRGNYPICNQYNGQVPPGAFAALRCSADTPMARYLIIQQEAGGSGNIALCEVEVWIELPLVLNHHVLDLRNQETFGSSVHVRSRTSFAVDGKKENDFREFPDNYPCFQSWDEPGDPNWWAVDMGSTVSVYQVSVLNRADCCSNRLDNFIVGVTNTRPSLETIVRDRYTECSRYSGTAGTGQLITVICSKGTPEGRYLIIQQPVNGVGLLTICEVEITIELP